MDQRAGRAAGLPSRLWPWSRRRRPGVWWCGGPGALPRSPALLNVMAARAPLLSRGMRPSPGRRGNPAPAAPRPQRAGGGGRRAGRVWGDGGGGGARTALFATSACAHCSRISHFSKPGSEALQAPPSLRPLPARLRASGALLPPLPLASSLPWGRQWWISGALSFIRKLLTKWKVNYGCLGDPRPS